MALIRVPIGFTGDLFDKDASIDNEYDSNILNLDTFMTWTGVQDHIVIAGGSFNRSAGDDLTGSKHRVC